MYVNALASSAETSIPSRLRLATRREVERRLRSLIDFFQEVFGRVVYMGERVYNPEELVFTQEHLESDKLALVLKASLVEGYSAPIIVVIGWNNARYIIDGHHRVLVSAWLKRRIVGHTLVIPGYKPKVAKSILEVGVFNPPDTPEHLYCWRHVVNIIRFLEVQHETLAEVWLEEVPAGRLRPTEYPRTLKPVPVSEGCPPLVYKYGEDYYVIDGHHRVCHGLARGAKAFKSIVFSLQGREIGIIKTAKRLGFEEFSKDYCGMLINQ